MGREPRRFPDGMDRALGQANGNIVVEYELETLLAMAKDKGHTPSRAQMRQALTWMDRVQREDAALLESMVLRCDSRPPDAALRFEDWQHPERALRLKMRWVHDPQEAHRHLHPLIAESLSTTRVALLRQCLRAIGRYVFVDLLEKALEDPRLVQDSGLRRVALESAARCAGSSDLATAWVKSQADEGSRVAMLATRERHRHHAGDARWVIPARARWLATSLLRLRFKEGMHDWVIREIQSNPGIRVLKIGKGELLIRCDHDRSYGEVLSWRTVLDHAFVQPDAKLVDFVRSRELQAQLQELYPDQEIPFRLALPGQGRQASWTMAPQLVQVCPQLVNEPRQSWLELGQSTQGGAWARPRLRDLDTRFAYRVAEIPAASHPTVAAGLAAAARPQQGDRIWDPFVGSGLELIEAGRQARCALLLGSDLDARALDCARANAQAAGLQLRLEQVDARRIDLPPLDKVISNPPHGRRVAQDQDLKALYTAVFERAWGALVEGGEIHWLCPQPEWIHQRALAKGGQSEIRGRMDLGGLVVCYQRIRKVWPQ